MKPVKTQDFGQLPEKERFEIRHLIENLGGSCESYSNGFLTVAMPNDNYGLLMECLPAYGMEFVDMAYMPLCSDKPPARLRHHYKQPKTDRPAWWLFAHFAYVK